MAQCSVRAKISESKGSDNVSDYAREKFYRRRKLDENRKGVKQARNMCSTGQPLIVSHFCKMKFTIYISEEKYFYYIKSGLGNPFHKNHAKKLAEEMKLGKHTDSQETLALRKQLIDGNAPTNVMRQVLTA